MINGPYNIKLMQSMLTLRRYDAATLCLPILLGHIQQDRKYNIRKEQQVWRVCHFCLIVSKIVDL